MRFPSPRFQRLKRHGSFIAVTTPVVVPTHRFAPDYCTSLCGHPADLQLSETRNFIEITLKIAHGGTLFLLHATASSHRPAILPGECGHCIVGLDGFRSGLSPAPENLGVHLLKIGGQLKTRVAF